MTPNHDSVKAGVFDAWNWWLSQHDISVPETIGDAVEAAVKNWLNLHADGLFREAVAGAVRTTGFAGRAHADFTRCCDECHASIAEVIDVGHRDGCTARSGDSYGSHMARHCDHRYSWPKCSARRPE